MPEGSPAVARTLRKRYKKRPRVTPHPEIAHGGNYDRKVARFKRTTPYKKAIATARYNAPQKRYGGKSERENMDNARRQFRHRQAAQRKKAAQREQKRQRAVTHTLFSLLEPGNAGARKAWFYSDPKKLSRSNFDSLAEQAWPHLGLKGKRPKIVYDDKGYKGIAAYVMRGDKKVHVSPNTVTGQQFGTRSMQDYNRLVIPHEFAHTRQRRGTKAQREGGADEFAQTIGRRAYARAGIRKPRKQGARAYAGYRKQVRKKGRNWLLKGQFR